ncbi:MAG: PASTA domain-containing protein, partial [Thermoleophilaceae bacterium]
QTEVPDVVGLPEGKAIKKLNDAGFRTDSDRQFSSEVAEGLVVSTLPAAGTERTRGSSIQVIVSDGARQVEVPGVVGESRDGAIGTLEAQGFDVDVAEVESDAPADEVIDQSPGGGTVVDEGATVEISVSTGPPAKPEVEMVTVPGVVGLSESAASSQLSAAGLDVATSDQVTEDEGEDGVVLSQSPGGGAEIEAGTTVTIVVGRFEAPPQEPPAVEPPSDKPRPDGEPPPEPPANGGAGRR